MATVTPVVERRESEQAAEQLVQDLLATPLELPSGDASATDTDSDGDSDLARLAWERAASAAPGSGNTTAHLRLRPKRNKRTSAFRGVRRRAWGTFAAEIHNPMTNQRVWLGTWSDAKTAAIHYDAAARYLRGNRTRLNFPPEYSNHIAPPLALTDPIAAAAAAALGDVFNIKTPRRKVFNATRDATLADVMLPSVATRPSVPAVAAAMPESPCGSATSGCSSAVGAATVEPLDLTPTSEAASFGKRICSSRSPPAVAELTAVTDPPVLSAGTSPIANELLRHAPDTNVALAHRSTPHPRLMAMNFKTSTVVVGAEEEEKGEVINPMKDLLYSLLGAHDVQPSCPEMPPCSS